MAIRTVYKEITFTETPLNFWINIDGSTSNGELGVLIGATYIYYLDLTAATQNEWFKVSNDITDYIGQTATLTFTATAGTGGFTVFAIDDISQGTGVSADTYEITAPATWEFDPATVPDYNAYLKACNIYATTLDTPNYGTGNIIIDFATYIGNTTPATTWRIDRDIFRADINEDTTRLATVIKSKGTGMCSATMFSYMADFATHLTVASIDSHLNCPAPAGSATLYVTSTTCFGTQWGYGTDIYLQVGTGASAAKFRVDSMGAVATSPYINLSDPASTTVAYAAYTPVLSVGCFNCTGATGDIDAFITDVTSQSASYQTKSILIGSEVMKLNDQEAYGTHSWYERIDNNNIKLYPYPDNRPAWDYGYAYSHTKDSIVYSNSWQLPARAPATSQFFEYGWLDTHVSGLGVVENDTLDKLCWGILGNGTTNIAWGQFIMPAISFPTNIDVGDWVSIEERTGTGTTNYRIVALEYSQRNETMTISIGSVEDYYIDQAAKARSSFDLAYSK